MAIRPLPPAHEGLCAIDRLYLHLRYTQTLERDVSGRQMCDMARFAGWALMSTARS